MEAKQRFIRTLILATFIVGGIWLLLNKDKISQPADVMRVAFEQLGSGSITTTYPENMQGYQRQLYVPDSTPPEPAAGRTPSYDYVGYEKSVVQPRFVTNVIRIASFNIQPNAISQNPSTMNLTADICRRYDVIALQNVARNDLGWLNRLVTRMNELRENSSTGKPAENLPEYTFVSDEKHNQNSTTVAAIIYNRKTLEMDESRWYTVNDPDDILSRKPIVGWFRTRGPDVNRAFTFTLVNLSLHSNQPEKELTQLGNLFRAIRNDGRGEDDVVIAGDVNSSDRGLEVVSKKHGLVWVVSNRPTTTRNQAQTDNLIFNEIATEEFTGRGGVFDFLRHYNLRLLDAVSISEHLPVWAEFSIFEGKAVAAPTTPPPLLPSPNQKQAGLPNRPQSKR